MQFQKKEKRQTTVRFDSHHVRLRTGEVQRKTGSYMYRWTDKLGKRNTIYAATLEVRSWRVMKQSPPSCRRASALPTPARFWHKHRAKRQR